MKKIFILTLLFSIVASGRVQATKRIPNVPIAGFTKTLSEYRSNPVDSESYHEAKAAIEKREAEVIMKSIKEYQERQEKTAEEMMWQNKLEIEQVLCIKNNQIN